MNTPRYRAGNWFVLNQGMFFRLLLGNRRSSSSW